MIIHSNTDNDWLIPTLICGALFIDKTPWHIHDPKIPRHESFEDLLSHGKCSLQYKKYDIKHRFCRAQFPVRLSFGDLNLAGYLNFRKGLCVWYLVVNIMHILSRYLNLWTFWKLKIFSKLKFSNSITNIHKKHYRFISMQCSPKLLINTIMELDNNRLKFFINIQLEPILDGNA